MLAFDVRRHAPYDYGFGCYLALLTLRRQFGKVIRERVWKEYGRECRTEEMEAIAEHYGGLCARRLARQGELNRRDPLLFAADELLVYGAISAVIKGSDVVFLTRDPLFMDQFVELMSLLGSDYIASEYGRRYAEDPTAFPDFGTRKNCTNPFTMTFGKAVRGNLRQGWDQAILPRTPYLINLHCWLLGRDDGDSVRLAASTFSGERGMHNLLRVKGLTGGRNVEGLDGRNIRAALRKCGKEVTMSIWEDRMIHIGATEFPQDDRLDLRIPSIAAADISRVHSNVRQMAIPWYEEDC
ncbi:MAG: hypothetical protein JW888_03400 [Pirellulales bacterium]|nr:hypothetical protein [Pirellulales bacterium]